jgi:DNA-binding transcriptional LysR family regulator
VDILHDDIDLAIRTNFEPNEDSNLIVRDVIKTDHCLVASLSYSKVAASSIFLILKIIQALA